jgi:hypothetical protein
MTRLLLPLLVLAPLASAQIGGSQPQGLASGLASGMSLEAVNRIGLETTWVKAPLDQSKPPPAWDPADFPNSPDYSIQGLFGSLAPLVELDAHSTGNDLIAPLTASGVPNLEDFDLWLGVVASVTNGALGQQGSFIDERRQATIGRTTPGADLLSFYFEESTGIHPSLLGTTFIEQASEDIGFQGDEDVDGLDFALGVLSHSQRIHPTLLFPFVGSFFFSLEPGCVDAVNNATAGSFALDGSTWVEADAATIYEVTWSATTGQWSTRSVYLGPDDLGLDADNDDVDAVAVNIGVGTVIFSTQVVPGRSQLQVYDPAQGVFALRDAGDNLTTERLGAIDDTDDVDAVTWAPRRTPSTSGTSPTTTRGSRSPAPGADFPSRRPPRPSTCSTCSARAGVASPSARGPGSSSPTTTCRAPRGTTPPGTSSRRSGARRP